MNANGLKNSSVLKNSGWSFEKSRTSQRPTTLPLTSLIDAFAIIVFYLLIATQTTGIDQSIPNDLELPKIAELELIIQDEPIVLQITQTGFKVGESEFSEKELAENLKKFFETHKSENKSTALLVQADQAMSFERLNLVLEVASELEMTEIKFAVLPDTKSPTKTNQIAQGN